MAVYDHLDHDCLRAALTTAFEGTSALCVTFDRIGWFDGMPLVLWASPKPSDALARTHTMVHGVIDPKLCRPHYRPGAWVPHCTLATKVIESRRDDALAFARRAIAPFLRRTTPVLVNRDKLWWVATAAVIAANALLLTTAHLAQAPLEPFARWALRSAVSY